VEIDISGAPQLTYETGDHVGIFAQNSRKAVEQAAQLLGLPLDTAFTLKTPGSSSGGELDKPFPGPITLETALSYFADLLSSPHKDALLALASCASESAEAEKLRRLASAEGKAECTEYITKQHRSLLEVMSDFPSAKPSIGLFFGSIAPRLQPRFYSISSSSNKYPRSIHVTCAVVQDVMPTGRVHEGVASTWLAHAKVGEKLPVFVRHSHFRLPKDEAAPVVMVGPGTGLAPFRGFIQERQLLVDDMAELGSAVLFFGCRNRAHDFIYEAELRDAEESGAISKLHVAFSRDGKTKDYVQHHMEQEAAELWKLLQKKSCHVYVCGDAKHMAKDVHRTLLDIAVKQGGMSGSQAEGWLKEVSDSNRYLKDVW